MRGAPPRSGTAGRRRRHGSGSRVAVVPGTRKLSNYLYLLPALALVLGLIYVSIGYTVWLSTQDWNGFSPDRLNVGLDNYRTALHDDVFWRSMYNVIGFIVVGLAQMLSGLVLAVLMHGRIRFGLAYRVCFFLPVVIAPAAIAPIIREMFGPTGQINTLMRHVGLGNLTKAWFADPDTAIYALAATGFCSGAGFCFVLYYAAVTQLDTEMLEAARVDGAGHLRTFLSIIVPTLRGTHLTLLILITIFTFKVFDLPQIITGGGPADSTQFPATYIYRAGVTNYEAGYGAAMTVVLVALCMLAAGSQLLAANRTAK